MRVYLLILSLLLPFYVYAEKPSPVALPKQTPLQGFALDQENVIQCFLYKSGKKKKVYNIYEVAMQSLEASDSFFASRISNYYKRKGLLPRLPTIDSESDGMNKYQLAAINWLLKNAIDVNGAFIWYYNFDNSYNDIQIKAPWGSAFGQAHVIKAFLHAYQVTKKEKYKRYALKAAKAYSIPLSQGGFQSHLSDGSVFFEEVPSPPAAHILNGHMISTIALLELSKAFDQAWLKDLAQQGVETLEKHLMDYDLGYWSRYDMNPKKGEIIFRLSPYQKYAESPVLIDHASLINAQTGDSTDLDVGAADDATGAWRISGVEWQQVKEVAGKTVRGLQFGPAKHCKPVQGGSIQNSYLVFQLPTLTYSDFSEVPVFMLKLDYFDQDAGSTEVEIQDINHRNFMGFRSLGRVVSRGSHAWKVVYIPVTPKVLPWFMGTDYQIYHIKLLRRLYALTKEHVFHVFSERWQDYLNTLQEIGSDGRKVEFNSENYMTTRTGCHEGRGR